MRQSMQFYCLNMFRAPICPSSGVQLINKLPLLGDHTWKAVWVVERWAASSVHCSEDVATFFEQHGSRSKIPSKKISSDSVARRDLIPPLKG
jgi:hypothetical protein